MVFVEIKHTLFDDRNRNYKRTLSSYGIDCLEETYKKLPNNAWSEELKYMLLVGLSFNFSLFTKVFIFIIYL